MRPPFRPSSTYYSIRQQCSFTTFTHAFSPRDSTRPPPDLPPDTVPHSPTFLSFVEYVYGTLSLFFFGTRKLFVVPSVHWTLGGRGRVATVVSPCTSPVSPTLQSGRRESGLGPYKEWKYPHPPGVDVVPVQRSPTPRLSVQSPVTVTRGYPAPAPGVGRPVFRRVLPERTSLFNPPGSPSVGPSAAAGSGGGAGWRGSGGGEGSTHLDYDRSSGFSQGDEAGVGTRRSTRT